MATGGCFDLLHPGHLSLLRQARALGDTLVVCVNSDESVHRRKGPERSIVPAADRIALPEAPVVRRHGGQIVLIPLVNGYSTSWLVSAARPEARLRGKENV
ncbi:MAG: adenylyltransferase/cytidyltransferase family protein [Pseudonocardiaceae bacterium]